jgi:hypothetical protein
MKEVRPYTRWIDNQGKKILVIAVVELDKRTWVYFRTMITDDESHGEESCYLETFIERFKEDI